MVWLQKIGHIKNRRVKGLVCRPELGKARREVRARLGLNASFMKTCDSREKVFLED